MWPHRRASGLRAQRCTKIWYNVSYSVSACVTHFYINPACKIWRDRFGGTMATLSTGQRQHQTYKIINWSRPWQPQRTPPNWSCPPSRPDFKLEGGLHHHPNRNPVTYHSRHPAVSSCVNPWTFARHKSTTFNRIDPNQHRPAPFFSYSAPYLRGVFSTTQTIIRRVAAPSLALWNADGQLSQQQLPQQQNYNIK